MPKRAYDNPIDNGLTHWDKLYFFPLFASCLLFCLDALAAFGKQYYRANWGNATTHSPLLVAGLSWGEGTLSILLPGFLVSAMLTLVMLRFAPRHVWLSVVVPAAIQSSIAARSLVDVNRGLGYIDATWDTFALFFVALISGYAGSAFMRAAHCRLLKDSRAISILIPLFAVTFLFSVAHLVDIIHWWVYRLGPSFRETGPFMLPDEWLLNVILPSIVVSLLGMPFVRRFTPKLLLLSVGVLASVVTFSVTRYEPQDFPVFDVLCLTTVSFLSCWLGGLFSSQVERMVVMRKNPHDYASST